MERQELSPEPIFEESYPLKKSHRDHVILKNVLKSVLIFLGATGLSLLFHQLGFTDSNIIMVYILGVLLTSVVTSHRTYSLVSSIASVFIYNYLFTFPRFSLAAYETGYPITFVVMFLTAYITGTLAIRYKEQAGQSAKNAYRARILLDTAQMLSRAAGKEEILDAAAKQIRKLINRNLLIFEAKGQSLQDPLVFEADKDGGTVCKRDREKREAKRLLDNDAKETLSDLRYLYLAMKVQNRIYGVVAVQVEQDPLEEAEISMLLSVINECALALENEKNAREKEAAAVLAESEQLRANLLRTISHDLRTPLTAISGHASNLLYNEETLDENTRKQIYSDIYEDSMWLIELVENLLYATRIEEGRMTLQTTSELLGEIVEEAVRYIERKAKTHRVVTSYEEELLLVKADAKLIMQVIINIVDNAIKYTPPGSMVSVTVKKSGQMAKVIISDTGNGIPDAEKEKIFEKFYSGGNRIADNRRSLGLGLYLCRAIIEAHQGTICVKDNQPHGAVFEFTLPLEEVRIYDKISDLGSGR